MEATSLSSKENVVFLYMGNTQLFFIYAYCKTSLIQTTNLIKFYVLHVKKQQQTHNDKDKSCLTLIHMQLLCKQIGTSSFFFKTSLICSKIIKIQRETNSNLWKTLRCSRMLFHPLPSAPPHASATYYQH